MIYFLTFVKDRIETCSLCVHFNVMSFVPIFCYFSNSSHLHNMFILLYETSITALECAQPSLVCLRLGRLMCELCWIILPNDYTNVFRFPANDRDSFCLFYSGTNAPLGRLHKKISSMDASRDKQHSWEKAVTRGSIYVFAKVDIDSLFVVRVFVCLLSVQGQKRQSFMFLPQGGTKRRNKLVPHFNTNWLLAQQTCCIDTLFVAHQFSRN